MTQDEIIAMAREAGFHIENWSFGERASVYESGKTIDITNELKDFASLVAAYECEKLKNVAIYGMWLKERDLAIEYAVLAEREACAKVCDEQFKKYGCVADKCAAVIRARGEK